MLCFAEEVRSFPPLAEPRIIFLDLHVLSLSFSTFKSHIMPIFARRVRVKTPSLKANPRESGWPISCFSALQFVGNLKRRARLAECLTFYTRDAVEICEALFRSHYRLGEVIGRYLGVTVGARYWL
jgi:hypothetical protein